MTTALCPVEGCVRLRHRRGRMCSMHSERLRRTGDLGPAGLARRADLSGSITSEGYLVLTGSTHELAGSQGKVLVHRVVLFEKIGPGSHPCHWCGRTVTWRTGAIRADSLIADHVDEDRLNNDPANLVPSCNRCNTTRGRSHA